jgi:hypothetical protein
MPAIHTPSKRFRSSLTSPIVSWSCSGGTVRSNPSWCGKTTGKSGGIMKMLRRLYASKKSNAMSVWYSSRVWNATNPCSTSCVVSSIFARVLGSLLSPWATRSSAHFCKNSSIPFTPSWTAEFAILIISSSKS